MKQTNQEAGSLTSAMVTGGDMSPTQGNYTASYYSYLQYYYPQSHTVILQTSVIFIGVSVQESIAAYN